MDCTEAWLWTVSTVFLFHQNHIFVLLVFSQPLKPKFANCWRGNFSATKIYGEQNHRFICNILPQSFRNNIQNVIYKVVKTLQTIQCECLSNICNSSLIYIFFIFILAKKGKSFWIVAVVLIAVCSKGAKQDKKHWKQLPRHLQIGQKRN